MDLWSYKKIKFLGKLKVIEDLLAITDIFLLPSQTESFGLVALEAMASNTELYHLIAEGYQK